MSSTKKRRSYKRTGLIIIGFILFLFISLIVVVNIFLEPTLRKKLHTLIIQGSDSLYTYKLGKLHADFLGGNVGVENLEINVDSSRYKVLKEKNALPSLTMQLKLKRGQIKGIGIFAILFGKKISIQDIISNEADIELSRHWYKKDSLSVSKEAKPLWKTIQPAIKSIAIAHVKFDGVKLLYKNADTSESVKLQFDRFDARLDDIRVDSLAALDTTRTGFTKIIFVQVNHLKFRTADSSYKMKAELIRYSSKDKTIEIDSFKLQPTLSKEEYSKNYGIQKALYYVAFDKVKFTNSNLENYLDNNIIGADSIFFNQPQISVYFDKSQLRLLDSKIGKYPHQQLLNSYSTINIKNIVATNASVQYTEKSEKTSEEGSLQIKDLNFFIKNITNDPALIKQNSICTAEVQGKILNTSPIAASFKFYLDSANGRFDVDGSVKDINAAQINPLAVPLANVQLPSFDLHQLNFQVKAEDFSALANVQMRYNNLSLLLRKTDEHTGIVTTKKFLTKLINKYAIYSNNPGSDGIERKATSAKIARLTTQAFFGVIWKVVFAGMQNIMLKSGTI